MASGAKPDAREADARAHAAWPERVLARLEQLCDTGVLLFAAFTLLVHFMVFAVPGTFAQLRWLTLGLAPLPYFAWRLTRVQPPAPGSASSQPPAPLSRLDRSAYFLVACGLVAAIPLAQNYLLFWGGSLLLLAVLYLRSASARAPLLPAPAASRAELFLLLALIALSIALSAVAHRPDSDDGFFINVPVWMLDNPGKVLYSEDGLHDLPRIPLMFPTYREHTIEVLYAVLAWFLHISPIAVAHLLLPPFSSLLCVVASALLLRALLPRAWALATIALVGFWIAMGDTHEGFANHAYVRIFQGKAVLVTALLPYLAYNVIRFMESGRTLHWLLLLACVICAAGLSATGLAIAPLALGAAACACWQPTRRHSQRFLATLACAAYVIAVGLVMRNQVGDKMNILNSEAMYGYVKHFPDSYVQILGAGPYMYLHVLGVLGAAALALDAARRRWFAGLGLVYFALIMNPFLYELWVNHVTPAPVAWRLWWIAPVPVLVAITLAAPFAPTGAEGARPKQLALFAAVVVLTFCVVPQTWSLSRANGVSFDWPRLKVPPGDYAVAATAQRLTPHGYTVLAPREITMWITTRRGHPRVIAHKENYLKVMIPYIGPEQFSQRMHLFLFISGIGRAPRSPQLLADSLDPLRIGFVASLKTLPWRREVDEVMQTAGFRRTEQHGYVLWYRPAASAGLLIGALKTAVVAATGKTQKCAADAQRKPRRACLP